MRHILEFNSYSDEATKNIPKDLLFDEDVADVESSEIFNSLTPKQIYSLQTIMKEMITTRKNVSDIIDELYLDDEDTKKIEQAMSGLHDVFLKVMKYKNNKN